MPEKTRTIAQKELIIHSSLHKRNLDLSSDEIPPDLAKRILMFIQKKRKKLPLRDKMVIDASVRSIMWGKKRDMSKRQYNDTLKSEYKQLIKEIELKGWGEKKVIKRFIESTMVKMYNID